MADPICRWRNPSQKTVAELLMALPMRASSVDTAKEMINRNWGDDFFHTAYQLAAQLGLFYTDNDQYRRIAKIDPFDILPYLKKWMRNYVVPNPYTRGFNDNDSPVFFYRAICQIAMENKTNPVALNSALSQIFPNEQFGNIDIVKNAINNFGDLVKVNGAGDIEIIDEEGAKALMELLPYAADFDRGDKKAFFNRINNIYEQQTSEAHKELLNLTKPFILLAGISGTGKTRFVTQQANKSAEQFGLREGDNYCLVPVRPDWHEPSDLLGYISRINGTKYIATDFLKFMVKAVVAAVDCVQDEEIVWKDLSAVAPYWLCLDEMNLAPVEQYFADYLSILEMREWKEGSYSSKPMMQPSVIKQLAKSTTRDGISSLDVLWDELFEGVESDNMKDLCDLFNKSGIPLPPNLIVAGTVNMDETTHGFSRKVIDRALTIDFQEFFKNDYDTFFGDQVEPRLFTFPLRVQASRSDLPEIDADGEKSRSIEFLKLINQILINTPFELAYRALNELLLTVSSFSPYEGDEAELKLHAVWDDFLMQKVLPRIEGDSQKLRFVDEQGDVSRESKELKGKENIYGKGSVLHQLYALLETDQLADIWGDEEVPAKRPDLLRDTSIDMKCRSKKKLLWMMKRLKANHFTDFWV
jgi:hypothetical protein